MTVHSEAAQALIVQVRALREKIPNLVNPASKDARVKLASAASVPADFVERIAVAVENTPALVRGATDPATSRDRMAYVEAWGPVADEVEALARVIRHTVALVRNQAGADALTTYALAQRLAQRPEHADLIPHVADMRRTLRKRGGRKAKAKAEQPTPAPATTAPVPSPAAPATSPTTPVTTPSKQ